MSELTELRWPDQPPTHSSIVLREFHDDDVAFAQDLSTDPYVPLVGSLPAHATRRQASEWLQRQQGRFGDGTGFSFAIADAATNLAVGQIELWLAHLPQGRAEAGYAVAPSARGRGAAASALQALTTFAWTIPALHRIELYIEPTNIASIHTANRAGYDWEGLLRSHQEIDGSRRDMALYAALRPA